MQFQAAYRTLATGIAMLALMAGCGGGGGETPSDPPSRAEAIQAVVPSQVSAQADVPATFSAATRWIWNPVSSVDQWVAFRKSFSLASAPTSAVTRIAVDTHYWLYVNGQLVTFEGGAKRGPNARDSYVDQVDIARYLRSGPNTVALVAWHLGKSGAAHQDSGAGGLLFQSDIALPGGSTAQVVSDTSWKQTLFPGYAHETAGVQPNYRLAEWNVYFDARQAASMAHWTEPGYSDTAWAPAADKGAAGAAPWNQLMPRGIPAYRFSALTSYVNQASLPVSGTGTDIAAVLPSNLQVTPYLRVDAPAGLTISIQTDHYLDGGNGSDANVRATYVTTGGVQEFEALGWMSGTQVIYKIPAGVTILSLQYRESGYDTQFAGSFTSNDPFFNTLWSKLQRTIYVNMRDTFMDCPTRERAPWWGDIAVDVQASAYMFDTKANALVNKNISQLVGWQRPTGVMFSPFPGAGSAELSVQTLASIAAFAPYYRNSGDASALGATTYQAVKTYMNLWTFDSQGLVNHRPGDWDWEDWGSNIDARVLDNAWYVKALDATILLANLTGNAADVAAWQSRRNSIATNFDRVLWNTTQREYRSPGYTGDTDDRANALAVSAGLASPANYADIAAVLRSHQNASPYMETYVIEALYLMRRPVDAQNRMVARYSPQVNDAGYTLWELWQKGGWGTDNHGWNGAPAMLSIHGVGARPTGPGWSSYDLLPQMGRLTRVDSTVPTPRGALRLAIDTTLATRYTMSVDAPAGTTGRIGLPRLATAPVVTANGSTVFQANAPQGTVNGLQYAGSDSDYLYFTASPGHWDFVVSGTSPVVTPPVSGWSTCSVEGGLCLFDGTAKVRYGSGTTFFTATLSNGVACTNASFGGDPTPQVAKHCEVEGDANAPAGSVFCAAEGGHCAFSGPARVAYGANGRFNTQTLANGTACSNAVFGDPLLGTPKSCYQRTVDPWALCADEGGTCASAGGKAVARYGVAGAHRFKVIDGSTPCNVASFGGDPAPAAAKQCSRSPLPVEAGWTSCASEGGNCAVSGTHTVGFGVNGAFVFREVSGGIACTNAAFGVDPAVGVVKSCYVD